MREWLLVGIIVGSTVMGDVLQSLEMKRAGELKEFHPSGLGRYFASLARRKFLILAIAFMAVSFFAFIKLLSFADLSFAVPATAGSLVLETLLARLILKEHVDRGRWAGVALVAFGVALLAH
jgi:drug/metabolite transporter (DMT)-like permease